MMKKRLFAIAVALVLLLCMPVTALAEPGGNPLPPMRPQATRSTTDTPAYNIPLPFEAQIPSVPR